VRTPAQQYHAFMAWANTVERGFPVIVLCEGERLEGLNDELLRSVGLQRMPDA
jgi:hypothetical protein